jgi:cytochrome c oxidase cbb3-type subunit 4
MNINMVVFLLDTFIVLFFVAIVIWAWSGRRKQRFDEAANIPLNDEDCVSTDQHSGQKHG